MEENSVKIEIDSSAGFCQGVVNAIKIAESELKKNEKIYCLGDIVHNKTEVERLESLGLISISYKEFEKLSNCKVIVRAHGEPPSTFEAARERGITIINATCPIVFKLQKEIKDAAPILKSAEMIIVGKKGHPEVLGLLGQIDGKARVISSVNDLQNINTFKKELIIFSQTTMDRDVYAKIIKEVCLKAECRRISITNSICKHVLKRKDSIIAFARTHQVVFFVSSYNSSNGVYLFNICKSENPKTYLLNSVEEIDLSLLSNAKTIGISGATSTPMWLMEKVSDKIKSASQMIN